MLGAGFAVMLLLAGSGDEGSREEKFRGALIDPVAVQKEIDLLERSRPDVVASAVGMSAGGTVAVGGLIAFAIAVTTPGVGIMGIIIGVTLVSVGSIVALITGGVLIATMVERGKIDERLRVLNEQLTPAPASGLPHPSPGLLLARF